MKLKSIYALALLCIVLACCASCSSKGTSSNEASEYGESGADDAPRNHPSPDQDGLIYVYSNSHGRVKNKTVVTHMVIYTDGYAHQAKRLMKEKDIRLHKEVSDDVMGAIIFQMQEYDFFRWPASKDYSQIEANPRQSISQITVMSERRNHRSAWTSDDTRRMTATTRLRHDKFLKLKTVVFQFCASSDPEVNAKVID